MRDSLKTISDSANWKQLLLGALVGLLVTAVFQPWVMSEATDIKKNLNAPGYSEPDIDIQFNYQKLEFSEGTRIEDFGNLTWNDSYAAYQLWVKNRGDKPIRDVDVYLPLPGCIQYINKDGPAASGEFEVTNMLTYRRTGSTKWDEVPAEAYVCSKSIQTQALWPGDHFAVEFVVIKKFDRCDILTGVPVKPKDAKIVTTYRWQKLNNHYSETEHTAISDTRADGRFEAAFGNLQAVGKPAGTYGKQKYGIFIVSNRSSFGGAKAECGIET